MMFASRNGGRIMATPGARASCPACESLVIAKCGQIVSWHWAHESVADCDEWAEPDSGWHLHWQSAVPEDRREVVFAPHRADAVAADGTVVELQHSSISTAEIAERESFYGKRMIWIFDVGDAYAAERLLIRPKSYRNPPPGALRGASFRWKHPRKSVAWCRRPALLDLGDGEVLSLQRLYCSRPPHGGWGWLYSAEFVRRWMCGSAAAESAAQRLQGG
ncbi:MAG TPA: competence protein CoiA family protein [Streptosporangiaceae bacterium]|nr:competence protein CoiA family protein [Streptosporangiaceae bacterium]